MKDCLFLHLRFRFIITFAIAKRNKNAVCGKERFRKNFLKREIMKKILLLLIASMLVSVGVQAQVNRISLEYLDGTAIENDVVTLSIGEDTTLVVIFDPATATDKTVTWVIATDKIEIDTIGTTCKITGKKVGDAILTVTSKDGNREASCTIRVVAPVTGMVLSENTMTMILERDSILIARVSPKEATNDSIVWVSRDSSIVNIESTDENRNDTICKIIAIKPGTTWIDAETVDGGFIGSCEVTVASALIESFTLDSDSLEIFIEIGRAHV